MVEECGSAVRMHGDPLTLLGREPQLGQPAPDCVVVDDEMNPVKLSSMRGSTCLILSVPSLDTPVCSMETQKFNTLAKVLPNRTKVMVISMDLPFAQKRWREEHDVQGLATHSDHRDASFGVAFGVLIKELRLLARAVFVIDAAGVLRYKQVVPEITDEPDYDKAEDAVRKVAAART